MFECALIWNLLLFFCSYLVLWIGYFHSSMLLLVLSENSWKRWRVAGTHYSRIIDHVNRLPVCFHYCLCAVRVSQHQIDSFSLCGSVLGIELNWNHWVFLHLHFGALFLSRSFTLSLFHFFLTHNHFTCFYSVHHLIMTTIFNTRQWSKNSISSNDERLKLFDSVSLNAILL